MKCRETHDKYRFVPANTAGSTQYRVEALGRRVGKRIAAEDTRYTYDAAGHLIAESDARGRSKREVIWLGGIPDRRHYSIRMLIMK